MVTIYDIAKELKLNPSTVSRAFSNPEVVSEKTRALILEKAREMGYHANMIASQLRSQTSRIIALVSLEPQWCWFTDMVANGVQKRANELGYEVVVLSKGHGQMDPISFCEQMRFGGVIVASTELLEDQSYSNEIIPMVFINRKNAPAHVILPDDEYGIESAFDYLVENGHRKIGFINGPDTSFHSHIRYHTYEKLMKLHGFPIRREWYGVGNWHRQEAYLSAMEILGRQERPTALLVADDSMCLGVYDAARENGLAVGEELSIIGYDNADYADCLYPRLTTVLLPLFDMGVAAVEMLMALIHKEEYAGKQVIRGRLMVRESVGKVKEAAG